VQNFKAEDKLDRSAQGFVAWLDGTGHTYPNCPTAATSHGREPLLQTYRQSVLRSSTTRAEDNTAQ
jgi:hypothetical protein